MISLPSFEKNNEQFLFWMIALLPLLGSGITIVLAGLLIWALISLGLKRFPLKYDAADRPLLIACGSYICIQFLLTIYHAKTLYDFEAFLPAIIAFTPFLLLPRFRAAMNIDYSRIVFRAAFYGCCIAVVIALMQNLVFNSRAEGGNGNPLIFASVCAFLGITSLLGTNKNNLFRRPQLPVLGYCFALVAIAMAESRGPLLAILVAGAIFAATNLSEISRMFGKNRNKFILLCLALLVAASVAFGIIGKRSFDELTTQPTDSDRQSSSSIRLTYLAEGIEFFKSKPVLGYGAANRDQIMDAASEKLSTKSGVVEKKQMTSWHRYIPAPLRKIYFQNQQEKWLEQRNRELDLAKSLGKPAPPPAKKDYLPTYETVIGDAKVRHGHLHNEYLMHAVDGGVVGLLSYLCLVFGTTVFSFTRPQWKTSRSTKINTLSLIVIIAILAIFNVAFNNDIIAVTFMLLLVSFRIASNSESKSGESQYIKANVST